MCLESDKIPLAAWLILDHIGNYSCRARRLDFEIHVGEKFCDFMSLCRPASIISAA